LFCDVDDFCKVFIPQWRKQLLEDGTRKRQREGQMTTSEIMTIVVSFHMSHYRDFKNYYLGYVSLVYKNEFPNLFSYTRFLAVSATISGDYYQVLFHDDLDVDDEPYFIIQRQFEFPEGEVCHFESHHEKLCEHSKAQLALLKTNQLYLSYGENQVREIKITFGIDGVDYKHLVSTLKEIIPDISVDA
jgi:hypothetical protein